MSIRRTSIETYHRVKAEGLLSKMRFETYNILYGFGPMTGNQITAKARELHPERSVKAAESLHKRLSELRDLGVVAEMGEVICPISRNLCIQWVTTDRLPVKFEKPKQHKCKACNGRGYTKEVQARLF